MKALLFVLTLMTVPINYAQNAAYSPAALPDASSHHVVFREGFESSSLAAVFESWDDVKNGEGMSLSTDVPANSTGKQSLMMTYVPGKNTGGHLYKLLPRGYDSLYARYYVKFISEHTKIHHLVQMGGYNPPSKWIKGGAGEKPGGDRSFISGVEPQGEKWQWDFYSYWMGMHGGPTNLYYGNSFNPDSERIKQDEWICVEFMIKLNAPMDARNGEQAFWINGEKILHLKEGQPKGYWVWDKFFPHPDSTGFEGFQWRDSEELKINLFWLNYYVTSGNEGEVYKVLFDDIVISTHYVGPL